MNNSQTNIKNQNLSDEQIKILNRINEKLQRGDITQISKDADFTKEYVGKVLNPYTPTYNEQIVEAAINLIAVREQGRKKMLEKLPA